MEPSYNRRLIWSRDRSAKVNTEQVVFYSIGETGVPREPFEVLAHTTTTTYKGCTRPVEVVLGRFSTKKEAEKFLEDIR